MYENELYQLISSIVLGFMFISLFIIFVWAYCRYELRALKVEGYIALRLKEKELYTKREITRYNNRHEFWMQLLGHNRKGKEETN